ncbi:MAG: hypothetical protein COV48_01975 [Elusimicrobia bacterium CG11_big_fil_rev_8_21_14_0_20_64_6]|nr:MAG: hypothetical protein COV48_01975 [Elusimicrobia bacterium CG11_big_fil_rev_8_21_14_0_20_64_6]
MKPIFLLLVGVLPVAAVFLAGCATPPPRQDPMANMGAPATVSPYSGMPLALVYSENTKAAAKYLRTADYGQFDPEAVIPGITAGFTGSFKNVIRSETLAQAKASGADAIMVFDYYADIAMNKFRPTKMDAAAILTAPDGAPIDSVKVHSEARHSMTALTRVMGRSVDKSAPSSETCCRTG